MRIKLVGRMAKADAWKEAAAVFAGNRALRVEPNQREWRIA